MSLNCRDETYPNAGTGTRWHAIDSGMLPRRHRTAMPWSPRHDRQCHRHRRSHKGATCAANRYRVWALGSVTVHAHADVEAPEGQKPATPTAASASTGTIRAVAHSVFPSAKVRMALSKIARSASKPSDAVPSRKASRHPHPLPWACSAPWLRPGCTTRPVIEGCPSP